MQLEQIVAGRWISREEPDWTGLEALLSNELCGRFMWMGAAELDDGRLLGAYKHGDTRRYLHLDPAGATYGFRGDAGYCRVRHHDAIEHVFDPAWLLQWATEEEKLALVKAFDEAAARDRADYEAGRVLPPCRI